MSGVNSSGSGPTPIAFSSKDIGKIIKLYICCRTKKTLQSSTNSGNSTSFSPSYRWYDLLAFRHSGGDVIQVTRAELESLGIVGRGLGESACFVMHHATNMPDGIIHRVEFERFA